MKNKKEVLVFYLPNLSPPFVHLSKLSNSFLRGKRQYRYLGIGHRSIARRENNSCVKGEYIFHTVQEKLTSLYNDLLLG